MPGANLSRSAQSTFADGRGPQPLARARIISFALIRFFLPFFSCLSCFSCFSDLCLDLLIAISMHRALVCRETFSTALATSPTHGACHQHRMSLARMQAIVQQRFEHDEGAQVDIANRVLDIRTVRRY